LPEQLVQTPHGRGSWRIIPELDRHIEPKLSHDASTNALIERYRRLRG
jgi:hypothetical protein